MKKTISFLKSLFSTCPFAVTEAQREEGEAAGGAGCRAGPCGKGTFLFQGLATQKTTLFDSNFKGGPGRLQLGLSKSAEFHFL